MSKKKIMLITFIFFILSLVFSQTAKDADRLFREGQKLYKQCNYKQALEKFLAAAEICKELGPNFKSDSGTLYGWIGYCYVLLGHYDKAIEYYKKSLAIAEELVKKDQRAILLNNIGGVYYSWGKYDNAIEYFEKVLAITEELGHKDKIAVSLNNIGAVYLSWGKYDKSLEYFEKVLAITEELGHKDKIAVSLNNIGMVYQSWGQYAKAIEYFKKALAIAEELGLKDYIVLYLNNIGMMYHSCGQYDKAIEYYKKSLVVAEELDLKADIARALNNMGGVHEAWGQYDKAIEYYKQALAIDEELGRKSEIALRLNNIGSIYFEKKDYKNAAEYFNNSINIIEELRITATGAVRRDYLASQIGTYQFLIATYIRDNKPYLAFDTIELSSAKYLAEQMGQRIGEKELGFKGISAYQKKLNTNRIIINLANTDYDISAVVVVSKHDIYAAEVNKKSFIASINKQYERMITEAVEDMRGVKIVGKHNELEEKQKSGKKDFDNIINYYRYLLSKQWLDDQEAGALEQIGKELYNLLLAPFAKQLAGKTELIIIPDGILCFLPFETLIMPDGRYLIEKYHIKYTQSLTVSELIARRSYSQNRKPLLAFGGAVYEEGSYEADMIESEKQLACLETQILAALDQGASVRSAYDELGIFGWGNLPGTLTEVLAIKRIIPESLIYKGADVSECKLKQLSTSGLLDDYKVLHFATHGLVVPEIPELSAIVLSLFADERDNEDGYLTMKEIAMLNIEADFVNLSACETGLGKIYGGEGVVGLTQSFLIAGANGLSVSLWQVADESTMQFMIGMYTLVQKEGYGYDRAITEMKRRFLSRTNQDGENYSKPFYWAPFVYYGE
jgi:CHAT domain-containing protein/Tfp pilus assembly protein PilF